MSTPLTIEYVFGGGVSFLVAALWYYIKSLADRFKEAEHDRQELRERLHTVEMGYQTKTEAREARSEILGLLTHIKTQLKKDSHKLDRKADKT